MSILNWAEEVQPDRTLEEYKRGLWQALKGKRGMDREISDERAGAAESARARGPQTLA